MKKKTWNLVHVTLDQEQTPEGCISGAFLITVKIHPFTGNLSGIFDVDVDDYIYIGDREIPREEEAQILPGICRFFQTPRGLEIVNQAIDDEIESRDEIRYRV